MTALFSPIGNGVTFLNAQGVVLQGGKLYSYLAGSTTPSPTYTDSTGVTPNANPITLGSDGRSPNEIWLTSGTGYKFVLQDASSNVLATYDNISGIVASTSLSATTGAALVGANDGDSGALFTTLQGYIGNKGVVVTSIATLRALDKTVIKNAFVTGYYASGDGGGGAYYYDSSDTTSSDNGGTIIVANDGGRWKLSYQNFISVKQFGAKGDGTTDDSTAIKSAINYLSATGGEVYFPHTSVRYLFSTAITVPTSIRLNGDGKYMTILRYSGTGTAFAPNGTSNNTIQISDLTIDVTGLNAIALDASRLISCTFRSVRFRSLTSSGQTGVYANITNTGWTSYFNVFIDCTFDGAFANAVYINSSVSQYANRWRFVAPTFLSNVNSFNIIAVQGIQVVAPYFNEHTGVAITLGASVVRPQFSLITQETNSGGSLWAINAACSRLEVFGVKVFAGTNGIGSGMGLRAMYMADWDTGIQWSGSATATAISTLTVSDDVGLIQTGVQAISSTTTGGKNLCGVNTFPGAATQTITFPRAEPDAAYRIVFGIGANENIWYSGVSTTGFTAHSSNATSTAQFNWAILR